MFAALATKSILVVEDSPELLALLDRLLREHGYEVRTAADGDAGLATALYDAPDLVILDVGLPGRDGFEVMRELRRHGFSGPALMLTARGEVADRITGLESGADDYLVKPFDTDELVARVRALGRRTTPAAPPVLSAADIELDPAKRTVTRSGDLVELTRKEFGVLETLLTAQGAVVSSEELLDRVWDENADPFTTTVRVTMMTLRRKLGEPPIIDTVVGSGYRIDPSVLGAAGEGAGSTQ
jgi:DNA-binding response OmpR family regulator